MKISFHGACREVTGSCILIETEKTKFLLDCGMFQGESFVSSRNFDDFAFDASKIDFVLLSHAHIDHCGRIPKLYKDGFRGKIYCTAATRDLTMLMLADSAKIISSEALSHGVNPFYSEDDVMLVSRLFKELPYHEEFRLASDIRVRLKNSGHILGSSFYEIWVKEGKTEKKIVFSGDLGNSPARIIKDLEFADGADLVFVESTYAGYNHEPREEGIKKIRQAIIECVEKKGVLMIPIFALEKVQEILYELNDLVENKKIPYVPIFLDSPLAIKATEIYKNYEYLYDKDSTKLIVSGDDLFDFPGLEFTLTSQQSRVINDLRPPKIILAGGGMCVGGRIQYHLKFNLDDPNSHVLLVAYQVQGSVGRKLLTGHKTVVVDNVNIPVRAKVSIVNSYSAHADHDALLSWLKKIKSPKPQYIFVVHGEEEANIKLKTEASKKIKTNFIIPEYGEVYEF
ncbi:MBL fold hydrolase [Candidatus Falkowbacteria bacterium HGW-Falkowbacteria-1]|uniref:MBL fold hydrolase n=1 Tax=Candidatus Falkowbacteria bacterium HGW-Falkowbacteria-1 TaxID=2013768 RepID=A0A2N2E9Z9_9BACT|nr:MAG: MBL fold hydrolase [Candidatus Falkowbacteria bacterium HGW-Falkowbacteria-1]